MRRYFPEGNCRCFCKVVLRNSSPLHLVGDTYVYCCFYLHCVRSICMCNNFQSCFLRTFNFSGLHDNILPTRSPILHWTFLLQDNASYFCIVNKALYMSALFCNKNNTRSKTFCNKVIFLFALMIIIMYPTCQ